MSETEPDMTPQAQTLFDAGFRFDEKGDVCAKKHKGSARSRQANKIVDKESQNGKILEILKTQGPKTPLEIAAIMGVPPHKISGRFKFLRDNKYAYKTGAVRENSDEHAATGRR